jgi:hypothetical protein
MFVPPRKDLFDRGKALFSRTDEAINGLREHCRTFVQNPGVPVSNDGLQLFHSTYVAWRQSIIDALVQDLALADGWLVEVETATQQTHGQPAPLPSGSYNGDGQRRGRGKNKAPQQRRVHDPQSALDVIEETLDILDELPEEAEDFVSSVGEKLENMRNWIEEKDKVTDRMAEAIENMHGGALRWRNRGRRGRR